MKDYIQQAEHKGAVRSVQLLAYITLLVVLTDVVVFIAYSLRLEAAKDTYVFFAIVFLSILGSALHSAVGISLPHSGKFSYYKTALYAFLISDVIGLGNGIRSLTGNSDRSEQTMSLAFYTIFYAGCLITIIFILRFFLGSVSKRVAFIAGLALIILILLHIGGISYSMIRSDKFVDSIPDKNNMIRLVSNFVFLLTAVSNQIVIRIKPEENKDYQAI